MFRCLADGTTVATPTSPEISDCRFFASDELPRPISDFTIRRIEDAIVALAPAAVAEVPPRTWLE